MLYSHFYITFFYNKTNQAKTTFWYFVQYWFDGTDFGLMAFNFEQRKIQMSASEMAVEYSVRRKWISSINVTLLAAFSAFIDAQKRQSSPHCNTCIGTVV